MQQYEDGFTAGYGSSTFLSLLVGLSAFGAGLAIFLAALIFFKWLF